MAMIYLLLNPYCDSFKEVVDISRFGLSKDWTSGLCLAATDNRLFLSGISPSTPTAKIPRWHNRIKGAWLIKVDSELVTIIKEAQDAFQQQATLGNDMVILFFSYPEI